MTIFIDPFLVVELGRIEVNRCIVSCVSTDHFDRRCTDQLVLVDVLLGGKVLNGTGREGVDLGLKLYTFD